jgi:ribosome-associated toxin RatA of RatAB toxin-antitoxin module
MPQAIHTIEIDAPPAAVMSVLVDFPSYPGFLPGMELAEVVGHQGDVWEVRFRLRLIRELAYTLRLERDGDRGLSWTLIEGVFRSNEGGWSLQPLDAGARTRATYRIDVAVGVYVPGNIVRSLVEQQLPSTLTAFKAEIERRASN